jgi:hypothetical protein
MDDAYVVWISHDLISYVRLAARILKSGVFPCELWKRIVEYNDTHNVTLSMIHMLLLGNQGWQAIIPKDLNKIRNMFHVIKRFNRARRWHSIYPTRLDRYTHAH